MPRPITKDTPGVRVDLICEHEDLPVRGNVMASGDDAADRACEESILAKLRAGNDWAWFCAHVRVTFKGLQADDYLGACSYESEADFRAPGGYFDDMVSTCIDSINAQLADIDNRDSAC